MSYAPWALGYGWLGHWRVLESQWPAMAENLCSDAAANDARSVPGLPEAMNRLRVLDADGIDRATGLYRE
ncbi:MAG TPA: hypothetical protein VEC06_11335 [Paucimonas sp.]|nr:hypothetical protein [Paucimonas sp.]